MTFGLTAGYTRATLRPYAESQPNRLPRQRSGQTAALCKVPSLSSLWVIANPESGGGRGGRILPRLEAALRRRGLGYTLHRTEAPGHARELASAAVGHASRILVVGGDGTIHEIAGGLLRRSPRGPKAEIPPLAILPVGTGNDFFRMVRSPPNLEGAIRAAAEGVPRYFEVGEVRWEGGARYFVNLVGIGIDVEVLQSRSRFARLPGLLHYLAALASALTTYRPVPLEVTLSSGTEVTATHTARVLLSAVTVGPSVGGGFMLSPDAVPDDGRLDLFHARRLGPVRLLRYLPAILRGTEIREGEIRRLQGTEIRMERTDGRDLAFELDGELAEVETSAIEIRVRPGSLPVLEVPESVE